MLEQFARAGEFFLKRFQRAILLDNFAEAAMLLRYFSVCRRIRQKLRRRELVRELFVTRFDLCKFIEHLFTLRSFGFKYSQSTSLDRFQNRIPQKRTGI